MVTGDVRDHGDIVRAANVVVLNNVFEFFASRDVQVGQFMSLLFNGLVLARLV